MHENNRMNFENRKIMVVGLADTGLAVTRFLKNRGASVTVSDLRTKEQLGAKAETALSLGAALKLGGHNLEDFLSQSLIVLSPGVPHTSEVVRATRRAGIPVIGELELAAQHISEPIVAVTGTNGKTTTTELVARMLEQSGFDVFVGGNIGNPLINYVNEREAKDLLVVEVSSFQLDTMRTFKPKVGVLLNVTEDHLDRYDDFAQYVESKGRIFENQTYRDYAVLNKNDVSAEILGSKIHSQILYFNAEESRENGAWLEGRRLHYRLPGQGVDTLDFSSIKLPGKHNLENAAAASLAGLLMGASPSGITDTLQTFTGLHHRLEYVATIDGIDYYDDSKGTNVDAVARALESFDAPVVLIMGGRDKGGDYAVLADLIRTRVKSLIVLGEAQHAILDALSPFTQTQKADSLPHAVQAARAAAGFGDVVLLSPGCSSFDMFTDYAHRGEVFCEAVRELQ